MIWMIVNKDKNKFYHNLLDISLNYCKEFLLVERQGESVDKYGDIGNNGQSLLNELEPYLIHAEASSVWPGTKIIGSTARIYYYIFNVNTIKILKEYSNSLESWLSPRLPEDLCLLRTRKIPWLISTTHEDEFYFEDISKEERKKLISIGIKLLKININIIK